jgi:hypothetical protein
MRILSYRDLEAWRLGMDLAVLVYGLTKTFPREELYGLFVATAPRRYLNSVEHQ